MKSTIQFATFALAAFAGILAVKPAPVAAVFAFVAAALAIMPVVTRKKGKPE